MTEDKLCECGCGQKTKIAKRTRSSRGHVKGKPMRFLPHHNSRSKYKPINNGDGYLIVFSGTPKRHQLVQRQIVEKILGKPLPCKARVHHINEDPIDNQKTNLIVCENDAYHGLLHRRRRALRACGHRDWRKCSFCGKYDHPDNLYIPPNGGTIEHRACGRKYRRQRNEQRKMAC